MADRQNILWIVSEQQKASAAGCYGNPRASTPVLDSLAGQGILFEQAWSTSPICTPSRCSMLTGLHPMVHGVTCHQNRAPVNIPMLPELLSSAGYYTACFGHIERQRGLARGFHEVVDNKDGKLGEAYKKRYGPFSGKPSWYSGAVSCGPEETHSHLLTDRVITEADSMKQMDIPFFFNVCYEDAHAPYAVPPPFDRSVDPAELDVPPRGTPGQRPHWHKAVLQECRTAEASDDDVRRAVAAYYGMISGADFQVSRLIEALEQRGMMENTWVIFTSDHGDYAGEKGLFAKSEALYACLLHVPLLVIPPANLQTPRGVRVSSLVETCDIYATILGIAGIQAPYEHQSSDLLETASGNTLIPREYVYSQVGDYHGYLGCSLPGGMPASGRHASLVRSIRDMEMSYIRDPDFSDEAYDLIKDPYELVQVSSKPEYAEKIDVLKQKLDQFEQSCESLRARLGVIHGPRGFLEGWE